ITVKGSPESLTDHLNRNHLDEIIIAMPGATGRRIREVVNLLNQLHLKFSIIPSYAQLITGQVRISQIRPVEIQDLLGRDQVELETNQIRQFLHNKTVLVTGAGGSIGSELCRQIANHCP